MDMHKMELLDLNSIDFKRIEKVIYLIKMALGS